MLRGFQIYMANNIEAGDGDSIGFDGKLVNLSKDNSDIDSENRENSLESVTSLQINNQSGGDNEVLSENQRKGDLQEKSEGKRSIRIYKHTHKFMLFKRPYFNFYSFSKCWLSHTNLSWICTSNKNICELT